MIALAPAAARAVSFSGPTNLAVGAHAGSLVVGDFNGDARQDIAVVVGGAPPNPHVAIFLGNGSGGFSGPTNFQAGVTPDGIAAGDFNGDGKLDLAVVNDQTPPGTVSILLGNGNGTFGSPTAFPAGTLPVGVAVGDFNGDGKQDLAVANQTNPGKVQILLGNGSGGFSAPTSFSTDPNPNWPAVGDFNSDGKRDLAVSGLSSSVSVLLGNGLGGFSAPTSFAGGKGTVAVGDFNGDGRQDLAVADGTNGVKILLGNGAGGFSGPTSFSTGSGVPSPMAVAVADLNGDGKPDLAVANCGAGVICSGTGSGSTAVLLGDGNGGFTAPVEFSADANPQAVAVGDFNGDGHPDLAIANFGSNDVSVLLNNTNFAPYVRPKGATPTRIALVPAFKSCALPGNSNHGAPLSHPSCAPPAQSSSFLTLGTPDSNGAGANAVGNVLYRVVGNPAPYDVPINVSTTDVRCRPGESACGAANAQDGADYTGQLRLTSNLRITDRNNSEVAGGGTEPATGQDTPFAVTVPCAATASTLLGSTCSVSTSANAVLPGLVKASNNRAIWQLGQVQVFDGGASGVAGASDATLFEDQGVFVP